MATRDKRGVRGCEQFFPRLRRGCGHLRDRRVDVGPLRISSGSAQIAVCWRPNLQDRNSGASSSFWPRVDELRALEFAGRVLKVRCDACRPVLVSFNGERNHGQAGGAIYWDELSLRPHNGKYSFRFSALSILFKTNR